MRSANRQPPRRAAPEVPADTGGDVGRGWEEWVSEAGTLAGRDRRWRVWSRHAAGPPVVVLHEVLGPSQATMDFARWLTHDSDAHFSVHVPALFGRHEHSSRVGAAWNVCIRREFNVWRSGRTSRVVAPLRELVDEVAARHGGEVPVGVVGMCLTGGLVMGLVTHPAVEAAVASQPSLPMFRSWSTRASVGLADDDVPPQREAGADVTVLRYADDWMCPRRRAETIAGPPLGAPESEGGGVTVEEGRRGRLVTVEGDQHAVLTTHLNRRARALVGQWLAEALTAPGNGP